MRATQDPRRGQAVKGKIARKQAPTKTGVRLILSAHENYPTGPHVSDVAMVGRVLPWGEVLTVGKRGEQQ